MNSGDLKSMVGSLLGSAKPLCSNHNPIGTDVLMDGGWIVEVHCATCGFHGWVHPDFYYGLGEGEDILKEAQ